MRYKQIIVIAASTVLLLAALAAYRRTSQVSSNAMDSSSAAAKGGYAGERLASAISGKASAADSAGSVSAPSGAQTSGKSLDFLLRNITRENIHEVLDLILQLPRDENFTAKLGLAMAAWSALDGPAAYTFFNERVKDLPELRVAGSAMLAAWVNKNATEAAQFAWTLKDKASQELFFSYLAPEFLKKDPAQAVQWVESLPQGVGRDTAMTEFAADYMKIDRGNAQDWVWSMARKENSEAAVSSVCAVLAREDPMEGIGWVFRLPEGPVKDQATVTFFSLWVQNDPDRAVEMLSLHEIDLSNGLISEGVARGFGAKNQTEALAFADAIPDEKRREQVRSEILRGAGSH